MFRGITGAILGAEASRRAQMGGCDGFAFSDNIGLTIAQIYRIDILNKPLENE